MRKVLIIKPSSFGDIVHGLLVAHSIRSQCADVAIDWVARGIFAPIVEACPVVDRVIVFRRSGGMAGFWKLLRQIREGEYSHVLDMQGLARSGLMTLAARAPHKVGRKDAREGARLSYSKTIELPPAGVASHAVDILLQFCPALGLDAKLAGVLPFRQAGAGLDDLLPPEVLKGRPIVIFPGSRRAEKEWPGFPELTRLILERQERVRVIWAGSDIAKGIVEEGRFFNLTGKTSLEALVPLVGSAGVVVANDSGPMHLAAAMGVPTVAVFGPTDPARYGPYPPQNPRNAVVRAPGGDLSALGAAEVYQVLEKQQGFR